MEASPCLLNWEGREQIERTCETDGIYHEDGVQKGRKRININSLGVRTFRMFVCSSLVCVPHVRCAVVALRSAGLDPGPSSALFVIWDDPESHYPQVATPRNGGDFLPLGMVNEAAFRKLPGTLVFLPVSLLKEAPHHQKLPSRLAIAQR